MPCHSTEAAGRLHGDHSGPRITEDQPTGISHQAVAADAAIGGRGDRVKLAHSPMRNSAVAEHLPEGGAYLALWPPEAAASLH
jgi:hypothetical protein